MAVLQQEETESAVVKFWPTWSNTFATIQVRLHPLESGFLDRISAAWRMLFQGVSHIELDLKTMHALAARYNVVKAMTTDDDARDLFKNADALMAALDKQ